MKQASKLKQAPELKLASKSSNSDNCTLRTAKQQLSRRQIKRKERFAKYRLEKKIQRQLVIGNQQQQQPQQQLQQQKKQEQHPPTYDQQQQRNTQQHSAPTVGTLQQNRTEWNDQPRVVFVQVSQAKHIAFNA